MKRLLTIAFTTLFALLHFTPGIAQSGVVFSDLQVYYNFGDQAVFQATVGTVSGGEEFFLFIEQTGEDTLVRPATPGAGGKIETILDLKQYPLRPFARISYYFRVKTPSGESIESEPAEFNYVDNRFRWDLLEDETFQVYWQGRDITFGQSILNAARAGLESAQRYINAPLPKPLKIYVYDNAADLQSALSLSQPNAWVAGHASPELNTILISIPSSPQQQLELERQIPHEIAHILQYSLVGAQYKQLPAWLLEGSASLAELYPNPDYPRAILEAVSEDAILPVDSLCVSFPRDASGAFLAYAQSESFVRYIYQNYGTTGLTALFEVYADGLGCDEGARSALGNNLNELEYRWQQSSLGINSGWLAIRNLSPYLLLFAILVATPLTAGWLKRK